MTISNACMNCGDYQSLVCVRRDMQHCRINQSCLIACSQCYKTECWTKSQQAGQLLKLVNQKYTHLFDFLILTALLLIKCSMKKRNETTLMTKAIEPLAGFEQVYKKLTNR